MTYEGSGKELNMFKTMPAVNRNVKTAPHSG
jgi:hypothetical protein